MSISRDFKEKIAQFTAEDLDRMVRMGWEDRSTFEDIEIQFGLGENEFVRFMRTQLSASAFAKWRTRVHHQGQLKHKLKRGFKTTRFKATGQSIEGFTRRRK